MHTITQINDWLKKLIDTIQNTPVSFTYLLMTLVGITLVRNYIELYASQHEFNLNHLFHYTLFFIALAAVICVLFKLITGDSAQQTFRLIIPFYTVIWVAPIVDLVINGAGGQQMAYILEPNQLQWQYITFFGPIVSFGITIGMRTEIAIVLIGSLWFFYNKTRSVIKSLVGVWLLYSIIFLYVSLPAIVILFAERFALDVTAEQVPMTKIFFLITLATTFWFIFKTNIDHFLLILRDIRPLRWIHFQFMFILGVCLSIYFGDAPRELLLTPGVWFDWIFVIISITCAWIYSIIINNLEDIEIDTVANPERLTVTGTIDPETYKIIAWWILFGAISSAALVGFDHLFLVMTFVAGYFLYSAPPLRLKRVLILSKGIIAFNSLLLISAGYALLNPELRFTVPAIILPTVLIGFTLVLNFIDLKDYEGDKQAGIKTLPVVLGMERAKWIIGTSFIGTYLSVYYIVQDKHLLPALLFVGLIQYYLTTKKVWEEWKVLSLHLAVLVPAFGYLLMM